MLLACLQHLFGNNAPHPLLLLLLFWSYPVGNAPSPRRLPCSAPPRQDAAAGHAPAPVPARLRHAAGHARRPHCSQVRGCVWGAAEALQRHSHTQHLLHGHMHRPPVLMRRAHRYGIDWHTECVLPPTAGAPMLSWQLRVCPRSSPHMVGCFCQPACLPSVRIAVCLSSRTC